MARIEDTGKVEIGVSFPPPLDEPMVELTNATHLFELAIKLNELIERQNALVEIVKRLILK